MQKFLPIKKSIFIVCLAMMLCWIPVTAHAAGHREAPTSPTRILFVGNSYTQRNHMPNIFRKLCKSSGQNVIVRSLTNPGRSLKNTSNPTTANGRKLYRLLRMQRWDYVILQDRRYYPISKPQRMKRTIRKLAPYIQASGAKMVLYQTWAPGKWHNDYNRYDSVSNRSDYQSICSRSKFLSKLLKTFDKTFREIFPVFISTKRREKPSAFFDNNFVNNAYFSEAASSSSSHLASSSSKAPISSRMTCLCLWSS